MAIKKGKDALDVVVDLTEDLDKEVRNVNKFIDNIDNDLLDRLYDLHTKERDGVNEDFIMIDGLPKEFLIDLLCRMHTVKSDVDNILKKLKDYKNFVDNNSRIYDFEES